MLRDQLGKLFPKTKSEILDECSEPLERFMEAYEINTLMRKAAFLAQVGHESGGLTTRIENLNYSADRLLKIFPKYFTESLAKHYARKPEMIANRVYANRMGNGDENSGDGWRCRGKGYIQLTGGYNYLKFGAAVGRSLSEVITYLETVEGAAESACWFWKSNGLNELADEGQFKTITRRINGGLNGYEDRVSILEKAIAILKEG